MAFPYFTSTQAIPLRVSKTYSAAADIDTYQDTVCIENTLSTALTTGKYLDSLYIGVFGASNINSGGSLYSLWVDSQGTGTNSGVYYMARFSVQAGGLLPTAYIQFQTASPGFAYAFAFDGALPPVEAGGTDCTASGATDPAYTIAVRTPNGSAGYLRVWAAK